MAHFMENSRSQPESPVDLSVVIPAYRSVGSVAELSDRLVSSLGQLGLNYEIIFVEDDSPDDTWNELCRIRDRHGDRINLIRLTTNSGQHNALMCGFRHARGSFIATIDDDLQCDPEVLVELLQKLQQEKLDLVYGNYPIHGQSLMRSLASAPIRLFAIIVFGLSIPPTSVRVIRRQLLDSILYYRGSFTVVDGLLCWNTRRIGGMLIGRRSRPKGRSTYSIAKLVGLAFNIFTSFSIIPLRIIAILGAAFVVAGTVIGLSSALGFRFSNSPEWLSAIVALILMISGTQLLSLGLMCEYLGRIFISLNGKPQYTIREAIGLGDR